MFERFTPRARRVIVMAQDAARDMGHRQIKPEHLLVGLKEGEGMASAAMSQAGVDGPALRQRVIGRIERKSGASKMGKVPFSPEAKKALELSLRTALALGHNYIGTEHLFLGVQGEAEQRGQNLDDLLAVDAGEVRSRLMDMLGGAGPPMRSPALQSAMDRARQRAGQAPMTTGHLLAALIGDPDSQAARALAALGVSSEGLEAAITDVPLATTSDSSPAPQSVAITIGETTNLIADPAIASALQRMNPDQLRDAIKKAIGLTDPDQAAG
jgi:ATP-dependent Clp protease ATP-binding subunit ClpC